MQQLPAFASDVVDAVGAVGAFDSVGAVDAVGAVGAVDDDRRDVVELALFPGLVGATVHCSRKVMFGVGWFDINLPHSAVEALFGIDLREHDTIPAPFITHVVVEIDRETGVANGNADGASWTGDAETFVAQVTFSPFRTTRLLARSGSPLNVVGKLDVLFAAEV